VQGAVNQRGLTLEADLERARLHLNVKLLRGNVVREPDEYGDLLEGLSPAILVSVSSVSRVGLLTLVLFILTFLFFLALFDR